MKLRFKPVECGALILLLLVQPNAQSPRNKSTRPVLPTSQGRFISGNSSIEIPFEISNNLILLQANANDSAPIWFIFDTGAESTVIDAAVAKALRLKPAGKILTTGGTEKAEAAKFEALTLRLPNIEIFLPTIYGFRLDSFSSPLGKTISGVIGYDVIKEFVVEIDYVRKKIGFYKPETYQYSGAGEIFPLTIEEKMPFISASVAVEGRAAINGKFEIDSGSTGAILLNTPFVRKHNLLRSIPKRSEIRIGGVGGSARAYRGRVKSLTFGHFTLANPVARLSLGARGDNASRKYDGLIGGEILRRFKTIVDYSRRRMILEPNAFVSAPFEVDMSGMELLADGDDLSVLLVDEIRSNSPAAEAGVRGGDVIAAIDNLPIKQFTLDQVRQMFKEDGREYLLTLKRDGKEVRVKIKLRRLV